LDSTESLRPEEHGGTFPRKFNARTKTIQHEHTVMKLNLLLSLSLAALSTSAIAADTYNIDPMHSSIGFGVSHMVINTVHGKFNEFSGTVIVDGKKIQEAKGTIQAKSIDTGVAGRDKHLRSPDFFDVEKYPTITFQSKKVEQKNGEDVLVGDFTMHGVTKELALPVKLSGPIKDPMGMNRIGLAAKAKVNRKDHGISYNKVMEAGGLMVGEEIEIEINAEATKAK
jgi:polyisoprenoid-binding protein YceI